MKALLMLCSVLAVTLSVNAAEATYRQPKTIVVHAGMGNLFTINLPRADFTNSIWSRRGGDCRIPSNYANTFANYQVGNANYQLSIDLRPATRISGQICSGLDGNPADTTSPEYVMTVVSLTTRSPALGGIFISIDGTSQREDLVEIRNAPGAVGKVTEFY